MSAVPEFVKFARRNRAIREYDARHRVAQRIAEERAASGRLATVEEIAHRENLLSVFHRLKAEAGQAPGPDRVSYAELSRFEAPQIMRELSAQILAGEFRASDARYVDVRKSSVGTRRLTLRSIISRVVAAALNEGIAPYVETILLDGVHGYRPNRSAWTMFAAMEQSIVKEGRWVIAQDDIKQAFDNVPVDTLLAAFRCHIENEQLMALVERVIKPDPDHKVGIDQGSALSPTALNLLLHHVLDQHLQGDATIPAWFRYADNVVFLGQAVPECEAAVAKTRLLLNGIGMTTKQEDRTVDTRKEKTTVLGLELRATDQGIHYGIPEAARSELSNGLRECHAAPNPAIAAKRVLQSWTGYYGPALESERKLDVINQIQQEAAQAGLREVSRDWLMATVNSVAGRWHRLRSQHMGSL